MYKILIIASYDSFLKSAINIGKRINHSSIDICIYQVKKDQLSQRQLEESNALQYRNIDYSALAMSDFSKYDLLILSIGNAPFRRFISKFYSYFSYNSLDRPLIIATFPGIIFGQPDSILSRINADIILANSNSDKEIITEIAKVYKSPVKVINYGLANINDKVLVKYSEHDLVNRKNVVFIDQVKIPQNLEERKYVILKLLELARKNPNENFLLKIRVLPNEITVHNNKHSYIDILDGLSENIPNNFRISSENIDVLLETTKLFLSFSSTVILEALYHKIPCLIINDLGIREEFSNRYFLFSNIYANLEEVDLKNINTVNEKWYYENVHFEQRTEKINNALIIAEDDRRNFKLEKMIFFGGGYKYHPKASLRRKIRKLFRNPRLFIQDLKILRKLRGVYDLF